MRADPPPNLSWSFAPYTDEGYNSYSARNMVLYGHWRVDDFFPFVVYPLFNYIMFVVFKLLGLGFVQVKLVSLLASVASVFVLYRLLREDSGPLVAGLAALGMATSFPLVMYGRLGLVESLQILCLLLTGYFFVRGLTRPWQMFWGGLLAVATPLLVKLSAAFILPAVLFAFLAQIVTARHDAQARRLLVRGIIPWFAGAAASIVIWLIAVYIPHRADYLQYVLRHSLESPAGHPRGLGAYIFNSLTVGIRSGVSPRIAWTALFGLAALPVLAFGRRPAFRFLAFWFLFALLMLGYMNYRPDRYELVLIPALVAAFAAVLGSIVERGAVIPVLKTSVWKAGLYALCLWLPITQFAMYTKGFWGLIRVQTESGLIAATAGIAVALCAIGFGLLRVLRNGLTFKAPWLRLVAAGVLLVLSLRVDLSQYAEWWSNRTHHLTEYASDLEQSLPKDAVVAGSFAPGLLIGSHRRVLCITDWANTDDPVGRYGVTHFMSPENGLDIQLFTKLYPELVEQSRVFREYDVRGTKLTVYELPPR